MQKIILRQKQERKKSAPRRRQGTSLSFQPSSDMALKADALEAPEKNSTRQGFGDALLELAAADDNIVGLTADLTESVRMQAFAKKYPARFFNTGIAEQNLLGISAGLSFAGKIPFAASFAIFTAGRAWEQLRTAIAYPEANVKVIGSHAGLSVGEDGATHQSLSDIAVTRTIPNLVVLVPSDYEQAKKAVAAAAAHKGPVYIRLGRPNIPIFTSEHTPFQIGKSNTLAAGNDVALIATGEMVYRCLSAAQQLHKKGVKCRVIDMHTIKPLDRQAVELAARETKLVVTAEDHSVIGGLGSAVAEVLAQMDSRRARQKMIGVNDVFGKSGKAEELAIEFSLTIEDIAATVIRELNKEHRNR